MRGQRRRLARLERAGGKGGHHSLRDLIVAAQERAATGEPPPEPRAYSEAELAAIAERSGGLVAAILRCAARGARSMPPAGRPEGQE